MKSIIIYIIAINALLVFKLVWDWIAKNKQKRIINHLRSSIIDVSLYTILAIALFHFRDDLELIVVVGIVIVTVDYRWIAFDALFSLINGKGIDWHGTSSKIDVFLMKFGRYHFFIKLIPVAIGFGLIYYEKVFIFFENIWEILS